MRSILIIITFILTSHLGFAQATDESYNWETFNRNLTTGEEFHLDVQKGSGYAKIKDMDFTNGVIELEIKGKDKRGRSFVGLAFHGVNDSTYDAVYFRPFNFLSETKAANAVQYISHPKNTWHSLRKAFPGNYESTMDSKPDPNNWFKIKIVVNYPHIKVFTEGIETPILEVKQLSKQKHGWIGIWAGNGSEGWFRNIKITQF